MEWQQRRHELLCLTDDIAMAFQDKARGDDVAGRSLLLLVASNGH